MTKGDRTYQTPLTITMDPRARYTAGDRRAQFELSMRLYALLETMTFEVDRISDFRSALEARAAKLGADDPLATRLRAASARADELRKKIVATKEGGMITGEERLRELVGTVYSAVSFYEGAPTRTQVERTSALSRELSDVSGEFQAWSGNELQRLNPMLAGKGLGQVTLLTREEWERRTRPARD